MEYTTREFDSIIRDVYDHLYANSQFKTPSSIAREFSKLLYLLRFVETDEHHLDIDLLHKVPEEALHNDSVTQNIFENAQAAFRTMAHETGVFEGETISFSPYDTVYCLAKLSKVEVSSASKDVIGDALEVIRSQWTKRAGGQFFTDQLVTRLAMTLTEYDPTQGHSLIDICAGTGGFLLAGVEVAKNKCAESNSESKFADLIASSVFGQEIDNEVSEVANSTIRSRVPYLSKDIVLNADSLPVGSETLVKENHYTHAATNPPFGVKITVKDPSILGCYELAHRNPLDLSSPLVNRAPDILFIEQNVRILKPGLGKLAIVVPYQIMSGPQAKAIREWILVNARVLAVVDLPADTFQPHTGTKASLLVLQKRSRPLTSVSCVEDEPIFMSVPKWIGHDRRGNPVYAKRADGASTGELLTDVPMVGEAYEHYLNGGSPSDLHEGSFIVSAKCIAKDPMLRLNGRFYQGADKVAGNSGKIAEMPGWGSVKLKQCVERVFFPGRFKRNYVEQGIDAVPFFGGTNISQLHAETNKFVSKYDRHYEDLAVRSGWILVTRSGSCGIVSSVAPQWDGYAISEHVIRIVVSEDSPLPAEYIQLYLRSEAGQIALASGVFGSVIDEITPEHIEEIDIPVPPADVLESLVSKVRLSEEGRSLACGMMSEALGAMNAFLG